MAFTRQQKFMFAGYGALALALWSLFTDDHKPASAPAKQVAINGDVIPDTVGLFQGLRVPGSASDAKASGFSDCEVSPYSMRCNSINPVQILGVPVAKPWIDLNGRNHLKVDGQDSLDGDVRKMPLESLSYDAIYFRLSSDTANSLVKELLKDGWESWDWKRHTFFVKRGQRVQLALDGRFSNYGQLELRYISDKSVEERLKQFADKRAEEAAINANTKALTEQMKN